jgi:hypothetical protein
MKKAKIEFFGVLLYNNTNNGSKHKVSEHGENKEKYEKLY